jgi:four helix bundle protein
LNDLNDRLFNFVIRTVKILKTIKNSPINNVFITQLAKSSASTGANYEEAQGGFSRADFRAKISISLKEMRETNYWLRLIKSAEISDHVDELNYLINESNELMKILGSIFSKTRP